MADLSLIQNATSRARTTGKAPTRNGIPRNSLFVCREEGGEGVGVRGGRGRGEG